MMYKSVVDSYIMRPVNQDTGDTLYIHNNPSLDFRSSARQLKTVTFQDESRKKKQNAET